MRLKTLGNHLRFMSRFALARFSGKRMPLIFVLCVTNKCNLKCWYCYGEHPFRGSLQDFSTDELLGIVREIGDLGACALQLQGGEPLLRRDLPLIIEEAKRFGISCDMVTNGTMVTKNIETVKMLDKICVSLDGPMETNDRNRGAGSFESAVNGILAIKSLRIPLRISSVLTSETTANDIDWLVDFCRKTRSLVNFSPSFGFSPRLKPGSTGPHAIEDAKLRSLLIYIAKAKSQGAPIQFSQRSYYLASQWPFEYSRHRAAYSQTDGYRMPACYHGKYVFFIDADGSVYPCCNFWGQKFPNIKEGGLYKAILAIDRNGCGSCYIPAYIERNLFFNGGLNTWSNYIWQGIKGVL